MFELQLNDWSMFESRRLVLSLVFLHVLIFEQDILLIPLVTLTCSLIYFNENKLYEQKVGRHELLFRKLSDMRWNFYIIYLCTVLSSCRGFILFPIKIDSE